MSSQYRKISRGNGNLDLTFILSCDLLDMVNRKRSSAYNNDFGEQQPQKIKFCNEDRLRVPIPDNCIKRLDEIKNDLNLGFHGRTVNWLLPYNTKGLVELTKEMDYDKG